ncbi:MAG: sulfatase-like hydrolase/transferase [Pirellulales bacterium]|nr:sulfatase-like hydrolase/transferase [Pirellulales bacterium]
MIRNVLRSLYAACALSFAAHACAASRPNIVVLFADDAGYADFGFMNQLTGQSTEFKTPHLDAFAQQSVLFSNAYVTSSVCAASRAGLLTGRYQQRFGVDYNIANSNSPNDGIPVSEVLLPQAMKSLGYTTGVIGKWHIGSEVAKQPQSRGVDDFYGIWEGGTDYFYDPTRTTGLVRRGTAAINWASEASYNGVPDDPVRGRHFTDALGDEASRFIAEHATGGDPFFLYVPFTSPHSPYDFAKSDDLAQFDSTSLTGSRKNAAALTYALDRNVGNILSRLNDPNGDGEFGDSIADNTIVVFLNDNGGAPPGAAGMIHNNGPLRDYKGWGWEGGIRVPMLVKMPGVAAGMSNQMVSALDLFPTFVSAAGGTPSAGLDGIDLTAHLTGVETGSLHDALYWRGGQNYWAIRKGEFKLVKGAINAFPQLYKLNANGSGESTIVNNQFPDKVNELLRDYVDWETTLQKSQQTTLFNYFNRFDAFRHRNNGPANDKWRDSGVWQNDANPTTNVTLSREDSYANAVLVFQTRDDASYVSENNFSRSSGLSPTNIDSGHANRPGLAEFMLNRLRLTGNFQGTQNRDGTLTGFPIMFTKSLSGEAPRLSLEATKSPSTGSNSFAFNINMDVVLHADLTIDGDSDLTYRLNGQIRDFYAPRSLVKNGSSKATFTGFNTYSGDTTIVAGELRIEGANAALANTAKVTVGPAGKLTLASGLVRTPILQTATAESFKFTGGRLQANAVNGDLDIEGGVFEVGLGVAGIVATGDITLASGAISFEFGGTTPGTGYDQLVVGGAVALAGGMNVTLANLGGGTFSPSLGQTFNILSAAEGVSGTFSSYSMPSLAPGRHWVIRYAPKSVSIQVAAGLTGDLNNDGIVNGADLSLWKQAFPTNPAGDVNLDGVTDGLDFLAWQRNAGSQLVPSAVVVIQVPEPSSALLTLFFAAVAVFANRRTQHFASITA